MPPSARLFHCARCHVQVILCRRCDRGDRYCRPCAQPARQASLQRARRKYQATRQGRLSNAQRQRRFRQRQKAPPPQKKVTHQGSPVASPRDPLSPPVRPQPLGSSRRPIGINTLYCHRCGSECDPFLRRDFLRSSGERWTANKSEAT